MAHLPPPEGTSDRAARVEKSNLPQSLQEFVCWLGETQKQLWERRERTIGNSGVVSLAVIGGKGTHDVSLHAPSAEYLVMRDFLDLVHLLCPAEIAQDFHKAYPENGFRWVRGMLSAMKWLEGHIRKLQEIAESHTKTPSPAVQSDDDAWLAPRDISKNYSNLNYAAVESRLRRFREKNQDGWKEVTDRNPREAKYLYRFGSIKHLF